MLDVDILAAARAGEMNEEHRLVYRVVGAQTSRPAVSTTRIVSMTEADRAVAVHRPRHTRWLHQPALVIADVSDARYAWLVKVAPE